MSGLVPSHASGHRPHEVESAGFGLQPPHQAGRDWKRPHQPSSRLVETGTVEFRGPRTMTFRQPQGAAAAPATSGIWRAHALPHHLPERQQDGAGGHARTRRCSIGSRTQARWIRASLWRSRICCPTVRGLGMAHSCPNPSTSDLNHGPGRHLPHPALLQDRKPAVPVKTEAMATGRMAPAQCRQGEQGER